MTGMPSLKGLSARFSTMPEPGNTVPLMGGSPAWRRCAYTAPRSCAWSSPA
jgi:hypothetical protein